MWWNRTKKLIYDKKFILNSQVFVWEIIWLEKVDYHDIGSASCPGSTNFFSHKINFALYFIWILIDLDCNYLKFLLS